MYKKTNNKQQKNKFLVAILFFLAFALPCSFVLSPSLEAATPPSLLSEINLSKEKDLPKNISRSNGDQAVRQTLNGVYTIAAIIAVIIIIVAGVSIIIADGDSQKVATARKAIIYACVGLVIVGSAFIITGIVQGIGTR